MTPYASRLTPHRAGAFTLIELLVVLSVIALLVAIAVPRYFQSVDRSKEAVLRTDLKIMREAIDKYHADQGEYPPSLEDLVQKRYLRAIPPDPITDRSDSWHALAAEGESGIADVKSGAEGTAMDGTTYAEW